MKAADMPAPAPAPPAEEGETYEFDSMAVIFFANPGVLQALRQILRPLRAEIRSAPTATRVVATLVGDYWRIEVDGTPSFNLAQEYPAARVAQEMIVAAATTAAAKFQSLLLSGAILNKGVECIALTGKNLEETKLLGLHLHHRGWSLVALGYGFISGESLDVTGLPQLASVSSSSIDQIPPRYRSAIEASLWYDSGNDITFYTFDPLTIYNRATHRATLTHIVLIEGEQADEPAMHTEISVGALGAIGDHPLASSLRIARLTCGTPIASCDAIERWVGV